MSRWIVPVILLMTGLVPTEAAAQQIQVQQPAIRQFQINGGASVPDRGAAFLGGVGRGAIDRADIGWFSGGSRLGSSRSSTSTSAQVRIQDFAEMDREVLAPVEAKYSRLSVEERTKRAEEILKARRR